MSIAVPLDQLGPAIAARAFAYVLTVDDEGRPRLLAVDVVEREGLLLMDVGGSTARNVTARPDVTLVFPPVTGGGDEHDAYSLVVDGTATGAEGRLAMTPTWAVLHRPAPPFSG